MDDRAAAMNPEALADLLRQLLMQANFGTVVMDGERRLVLFQGGKSSHLLVRIDEAVVEVKS
jgi:hypothetical protein